MIQDPGSNSAWRFLWIHKSTGYDISPSAVLRLLFVVNLHELPHDSTLPRKTLLCDQRSPRSQVDGPPLRPSWTWLEGSNILHIKSLYTLVLVLLLTNWLYDLLYPRFGVKRIFSRDQKLVWWWRTTSPPLICSACSSSGASWRGWRLWPSSPSCTMGPSASLPFFVAPSLSIGSSGNRPQLCNVPPGQILSRLLGNWIPRAKRWKKKRQSCGYFLRVHGDKDYTHSSSSS